MIAQFPSLAFKNKTLLSLSKKVGCYHCCKIYEPTEIKEFTDKGQTALCPHCQIDSVVTDCCGFNLTEEILKEAHKQMF